MTQIAQKGNFGVVAHKKRNYFQNNLDFYLFSNKQWERNVCQSYKYEEILPFERKTTMASIKRKNLKNASSETGVLQNGVLTRVFELFGHCKIIVMFQQECKKEKPLIYKGFVVEHRGFEPLASTMRMSRATNCANAPNIRGKFCADSPITAYGVQNLWGDSRDNLFYQLR